MYKIKSVFLLACLLLVQITLFAQNNTNSPYTRYGYGQLSDQAYGNQRAMGGIGYGFRDPKTINALNPASFSSVDSMTFMLDMGITGQMAWFNDQGNKEQKFNGNLEYVAMQFPLSKNMGMGVGFKPISYVGYEYGQIYTVPTTYKDVYVGSGGVNQIYGALSYNLFKRLSVGVNGGYIFGDIKHNRTTTLGESGSFNYSLADTMRSSGFTFDVGFQYMHPLTKDSRLVLGGVYTPKIKINEKVMETGVLYSGTTIQGPIQRNVYTDYGFEMPQSFGVGLSYNKQNKLTIGADYLLQQWSDAQFFSKTDTLSDRTKINLGAEYIINNRSRNFFQKMRYRAGGYYSDSYIKVQGSGYKEYGASLGFGIPMIDSRSFLNLTFEYVAIRPELKTLIDEQYFKLTVSYTFNELWFFKRKVQ